MFQTARLVCLSLALLLVRDQRLFSQSSRESLWLAGRYDRTRLVVYFQAVKFKDAFPTGARSIAPPIADAFFTPRVVPPSSVTKFQQGPGAERQLAP